MDKKKDIVSYKFTKSSNKTCIEIMSGVNENDIVQNNENSFVTVNMPKFGIVWLKAYDSDSVCDKVEIIDPSTLQATFDSKLSSHSILILVLVIAFVIILGIVLFLFSTKKLCFSTDSNLKNSSKEIKEIKLIKK